MAEQRYQAVREVLDGASVMEVARRFGVSRQRQSDMILPPAEQAELLATIEGRPTR